MTAYAIDAQKRKYAEAGTQRTTVGLTGQQRHVSYWILTVLTARSRSSKAFFDRDNWTKSAPDSDHP
jgi:hypothetical protein